MISNASVETRNIITIKGSVEIVSDFFFTAINSILYQRGIYQPETFKRESKYGLTVLTTTDPGLMSYLKNIMGQMETWLLHGNVQRLVVVVTGVDTGETLERWQFNVSVESNVEVSDSAGDENENSAGALNARRCSGEKYANSSLKGNKSLREIHSEIQAIIRQVTASVSFRNRSTFFHNFHLTEYIFY
mmetsp:Transcript_32360/g.74527  ORF Transcript_32360/g.74527 Transcript_32360/m.74527 type:complete len:189 (-) Transcript_32360:496-1062(-)